MDSRKSEYSGRLRKRVFVPAAVLVLCIVAFLLYTAQYYHAEEKAVQTMAASSSLVFSPAEGKPDTGFIFYPGGKVEASAYSPLMDALSKKGYMCVIAEMPFNLAVFGVNSADRIMGEHPEVGEWYIGGHSLGGVMAASYAAKNKDRIHGLVLLASYSTSDLKDKGFGVLSVYGENDKVLNMQDFTEARSLMPQNYKEVCLPGGNHAYFGNYGEQKGDGSASITQEKQQELTISEITTFIGK
jgi:hypothetical protein